MQPNPHPQNHRLLRPLPTFYEEHNSTNIAEHSKRITTKNRKQKKYQVVNSRKSIEVRNKDERKEREGETHRRKEMVL